MPTEGGSENEISSDVEEVLQHHTQRTIVDLLHDQEAPVSLVEVASELAGETGSTGKTLANTLIELHDIHLPKLTESGLVEYDEDEGLLTLTVAPEVIETALEQVDNSSTQ